MLHPPPGHPQQRPSRLPSWCCAGRGQGISVPGGTDPAWACSSIREDHERVFGWGQQLFVIPHPGFKYNCLLQMND